MKNRKNTYIFVMLLIVLVSLLAFFGVHKFGINIKGIKDIRYGIDIRGGVEAVYQPHNYDKKPTSAELESAKTILETRLDAQNILDREITIEKDKGQILVRFPWKSAEKDFDPEKAISELGETAKLTFRDSEGKVLLEGKDIEESYVQYDEQSKSEVVVLKFTKNGTKLFAEATEKNLNKTISIYMDEHEISSPVVSVVINNGESVISNIPTREEATSISRNINSGSLPFSLVSKNHSTISPTCGIGALKVMIYAGITAFIFICVFMIAYYKLLGVVSSFALLLQLACQLLLIANTQITVTLAGIAGIILSLGMGVDANIVIAERIKEEMKAGKSIEASIDYGFHRAFSAVFDGNLTSVLVAVILIIFGTGSMMSFGYTLSFGIVLNFVSGIFVSKIIIKSLAINKRYRSKTLFGLRKEAVK